MKYTTRYLYDIDALELSTLNYEDALRHKHSCATALIAELMEVHYSKRDEERVNSVFNAIKFNKALLEELNG